MSFAQEDIERVARDAAKRHGVDFLGVREGFELGPEVRFKHRHVDWYGVLIAESQPSLQALEDEIDGLAESVAERAITAMSKVKRPKPRPRPY